jgi:BolA protein
MSGAKIPMAGRIRAQLAVLNPTDLQVIDESAQHAGHSAQARAGESHFRIRLRSRAFEGQSRLARHRMVHQALGAEILAQIHALALELEV